MKQLVTIWTLLIAMISIGQETKTLASQNGIKINYQLLLEEERNRKDKYILIVDAVNDGDEDLYYEVEVNSATQLSQGTLLNKDLVNFSKIKIRNSTSIFDDGVSVIGELSNYVTLNNTILMVVKSRQILHSETTFRVKSDKNPLVTNSFTRIFKPLSDFDIKVNLAMVDGSYTSSCGDIIMNVNLTAENNVGIITQTLNGKQFRWVNSTGMNFKREDNPGYSLTYNQSNSTFLCATSDGITCTWNK